MQLPELRAWGATREDGSRWNLLRAVGLDGKWLLFWVGWWLERVCCLLALSWYHGHPLRCSVLCYVWMLPGVYRRSCSGVGHKWYKTGAHRTWGGIIKRWDHSPLKPGNIFSLVSSVFLVRLYKGFNRLGIPVQCPNVWGFFPQDVLKRQNQKYYVEMLCKDFLFI